jgi:hypothetical protein
MSSTTYITTCNYTIANLLRFLKFAPQKYNKYKHNVHPTVKLPNIVQPFATPILRNIGPEKSIQPAAKELLVKSLAANSDAAYWGYVKGRYMKIDCMRI